MKIINHVLVDGEDLVLEELSQNEQKRMELELVRRMAAAAGGVAPQSHGQQEYDRDGS